jgi:hypothetical protein
MIATVLSIVLTKQFLSGAAFTIALLSRYIFGANSLPSDISKALYKDISGKDMDTTTIKKRE